MISQLESFIIKGSENFSTLYFHSSCFFLNSHLWLVSPFDHMTRCFLSLSLSSSWSDHTPHVSQGYQTGETSSDLANKRSINGAVERVTHASQNLLRSNNPLQLPLHWSDPWAASQRDWPEDSQSLMKSNTVRKNGGFKLPIIIAI